jgi:hypothetical protein
MMPGARSSVTRTRAVPNRTVSAARRALTVGAMAVALAVLVGCASAGPAGTTEPVSSPSMSTSSGAVVSPSASAAAVSSDAPSSTVSSSPLVDRLGPDTVGVVVATDGLRVRSLPTVGHESKQFEPTLPERLRFYVADGPVTADGYTWYQVQPYGGREPFPFGWIAGGSRDGEPWVERFPLGCDSAAPTAGSLVAGEPLELLFCSLGGDSPRTSPPGPDVEVEGNVYCTLADDHWGALSGPGWVDQLGYCELRTDAGAIRLPGAPMSALIDHSSNPLEGRYAIVGHFDDPGALNCRDEGFDGADPPDPAEVVLSCRTYFVVTSATPLP